MNIITLDAGGTATKYACFCGNELLFQGECPSSTTSGEDFIRNIKMLLSDCLQKHPADAIGISTTGQVDCRHGQILYAGNTLPGYTGMNVKEILTAEFSLPVFVENDVNAAAIGEGIYGAGKDCPNFLMATYGTGIGGAIMLNGKLHRGNHQVAGEFGHIRVHPGGLLCQCGRHGCYEAYASTSALVKNAEKLDVSLTDGRKIFAAFEREISAKTALPADIEEGKEKNIKAVVDNWVQEVSYGLISLIYIFNPARMILGGGIFSQPYLLEKLKGCIADEVIESFLPVEIVCAKLGNLAGVYGMKAICCGDYPKKD